MAPLLMDCIVPAAGLSSRMGSHKLLEPFGAHPLVYWAVHHAVAACERVIVVLGHHADAVRAVLPHQDRLVVITNTEYERGMLTSIARGAAEVQSDRFFVAPADMPFLQPQIFHAVARAAGAWAVDAGQPCAWFPEFHGQHGHPALITTSVVPALVEWVATAFTSNRPLGSMRGFLAHYPARAVPVDDDGSIVDIDSMETLRRYADRARELRS